MTAERRGEQATPPEMPVVVHSCSRLGMQATLPERRLTLGRWRREG